jgi:hypothetical protein
MEKAKKGHNQRVMFNCKMEFFKQPSNTYKVTNFDNGDNMIKFKKGPIQGFSWGKFIINGNEHSENTKNDKIKGKGKDIRIIGDDVSEWSEREGHKLTKKMITGIYKKDIKVLVIGIGVEKALKCPKKVLKDIRKNGVRLVILEATPKACKTYNRLIKKGKKVAMLAHGTC